MQTVRTRRTAVLAVIAVLVIATAWIAVGDRPTVPVRDLAPSTHPELGSNGTLAAVDGTDGIVAPMLGVARAFEPRVAPLWILPGLVAALAALCLLRRQRLRPTRPARRSLLRGILANRAPPIESFA